MADIAVPFKARAPRRTNLQKPLPRSKSVTEETVSSPTEEPKTPTEEPQTRTEDVTAPVFKASAPRRVNLKKPLPRSKSVTEEVHHTIDTSTSTNTNKHRLKSQMSVDSGVEVGDSNNNNNSSGNIYVGRNNSINEVLPDEGFNEYPEDILMIEEELSSLVIDDIVTQSEPCRLIVLREPISPTTLGHVDTESGGLLTPSGRRRMFCLHRNSMHNKKAQPRECIQYTADELLEIGASTQSKQTPESWAYLVHILPGICLSKVSAYFDTVTYQQERGYVVECCYVRKSHSNNNDDNNNDNVRHFDNRNDKQQNTARWTVPTNFFGSHSSNNNNDDNNNVRHFEHRNGKQQNSGRWTVPTNFPPVRNGFGRPNRTEEVLTEELLHITKKLLENNVDPDQTVRTHRLIWIYVGLKSLKVIELPSIDLYTKCDVSIRWDQGAFKLFAAAKEGLKKDKCVIREFTPRKAAEKINTRTKSTSRYHEEDFYINKDLPDKCPW